MGTIEERYRKRKSKNDIRKAVLTAVKIGGFLTLAMVAPNSLQYLKSFGITPGKRQKEITARSRDRLVKDGLLKYDGKFVKLTDKGQTVLESLELKDWKIDKPKKWDGKWRMLIFDIPETRKSLRDKVRHTLLHIGFLRIQDSVWIYPYDCEDFVTLLKADFKIGKDLLYLIVDSIEYDKSYKKYFNLLLDN